MDCQEHAELDEKDERSVDVIRDASSGRERNKKSVHGLKRCREQRQVRRQKLPRYQERQENGE